MAFLAHRYLDLLTWVDQVGVLDAVQLGQGRIAALDAVMPGDARQRAVPRRVVRGPLGDRDRGVLGRFRDIGRVLEHVVGHVLRAGHLAGLRLACGGGRGWTCAGSAPGWCCLPAGTSGSWTGRRSWS